MTLALEQHGRRIALVENTGKGSNVLAWFVDRNSAETYVRLFNDALLSARAAERLGL